MRVVFQVYFLLLKITVWLFPLECFPDAHNLDFLTYEFPQQVSPAIIDRANHKIFMQVRYGTDRSALIGSFSLPAGVEVLVDGVPQVSGVTVNDFYYAIAYYILPDTTYYEYADYVVYTLVKDSIEQDWVVQVSMADNLPPTNILLSNNVLDYKNSSTFIGTISTIDEDTPNGHSYTFLETGSTLNQPFIISNEQLLLTETLDIGKYPFTLVSEDVVGDTLSKLFNFYVTGTDFLSYSISQQIGEAVIDSNEIELELSYGTNLNTVISEFTLSEGAVAYVNGIKQISGVTVNDFEVTEHVVINSDSVLTGISNRLNYLIVGLDSVATKEWYVTVRVEGKPLNYPPDSIFISNTIVFSDQVGGSTIGYLSAKDQDPLDLHTFKLIGNHGEYFGINGNELTVVSVPDDGIYPITIEVIDSMGATFRDDFEIVVTNENRLGNLLSFGTDQSNYRIVGIPYQNIQVSDLFFDLNSKEQGTTWKIFEMVNDHINPLLPKDLLQVGKGYWFISSKQTSGRLPLGKPVQLNDRQEVEISLDSGWNLIANPLFNDLDWDQVFNHNLQNGFIQMGAMKTGGQVITWNGTYNLYSGLKPFEGGFVLTDRPLTIRIPQMSSGSAGRNTAELDRGYFRQEDDWEIIFEISSGELSSNMTGIGINQAASEGYDDDYDIRSPSFNLSKGAIYLETINGYSRDIKKSTDKVHWHFVHHYLNEVSIFWDKTITKKLVNSIYLSLNGRVVDMKEHDHITLDIKAENNIEIYYGGLPEGVSRALWVEVFPIPASDEINFVFDVIDLIESSLATINIFGVTGQLMASKTQWLLPGEQGLINWNISELGLNEGIYYFQLSYSNHHSPFQKFVISN